MSLLHPYRHAPPRREDAPEEGRDDLILAALLVAIGGGRVALALATGEALGTEPTIAAVLVGIGVLIALAAPRG